jgi:predicted nucleotidyltransferase
MNFDIDARTIYRCVHGSRAYGTNTENSDTDIKGIAVAPKEIILGFNVGFNQQELMAHNGHPNDKTIYSLQKFAKLASDCNPNIIEMLYVDDSDILFIDEFVIITDDNFDMLSYIDIAKLSLTNDLILYERKNAGIRYKQIVKLIVEQKEKLLNG